MMEVRDERRLLNLQRQLSRLNLLIIDELGFVPLSRTGAELLFEVFSQRYERGSTMVTTRSLAGKPLAGFCATRSRRIQVLYGMVVQVIRCNIHYFIDNRR